MFDATSIDTHTRRYSNSLFYCFFQVGEICQWSNDFYRKFEVWKIHVVDKILQGCFHSKYHFERIRGCIPGCQELQNFIIDCWNSLFTLFVQFIGWVRRHGKPKHFALLLGHQHSISLQLLTKNRIKNRLQLHNDFKNDQNILERWSTSIYVYVRSTC